jgi:hypothetical protein
MLDAWTQGAGRMKEAISTTPAWRERIVVPQRKRVTA